MLGFVGYLLTRHEPPMNGLFPVCVTVIGGIALMVAATLKAQNGSKPTMSIDELKQPIADDDPLESQEFYELMQAYRHAGIAEQAAVYEAFEAVKKYVRDKVVGPVEHELRTAQEFIAGEVGVEPELAPDPPEVD